MDGLNGYSIFIGKGDGIDRESANQCAYKSSGMGRFEIYETDRSLPVGSRYINATNNMKGIRFPAVYSAEYNGTCGKIISAAVGVGVPIDSSRQGIIVGKSGQIGADELTITIETLIFELSVKLDLQLAEIRLKSIQHKVKKYGAVIAACLLF